VIEKDRAGKTVWEFLPHQKIHRINNCLGLLRLGFGNPRPIGLDLDSVAHHSASLQSPIVKLRRLAVWALSESDPNSEYVVPGLVKALGDQDHEVRRIANQALVQWSTQTIPALIKAVKDPTPKVREEAIFALANIGQSAKEAVPALLQALKDENKLVRIQAVGCLGCIGPHAEVAVPALTAILRDVKADHDTRLLAARSLGYIGPKAKAAVPELIRAFQSKDGLFRCEAGDALGFIGLVDESIVPALLGCLKDDKEEPDVRSCAAISLGRIGPKAKGAIPRLIEVLRSVDSQATSAASVIRYGALEALGKMGSAAQVAVPSILQVLQNDRLSKDDRKRAATALGNIGPAAKLAIDALTEAASLESDIGQEARVALARIKTD
jgi:HEAT repeat protein